MAGHATVLRLSVCYALSVTSITLTVSAAPLVGRALAPAPQYATLPVSLAVLASMAASFPASLLMGRLGRRAGLVAGTVLGSVGATVATWGIVRGDFVLFCAGSVGIGVLNGFAQFYRFAAADAAPPDRRAQAVFWVLAGGVAAGVAGPALAVAASEWTPARFAGSYAAILLLYAAAATVMAFTPVPQGSPDQGGPARPLRRIAMQRPFVAAVVSGMVAYGAMSLLMTATPLSMQHAGHGLGSSAAVIQVHVVAMFAPSFFTGTLLARWGPGRMQTAGLVALAASAAVAVMGQDRLHFMASLVLPGLAWNLLFVTGSAMLIAVHRPAEKAKVQGLNDLLVFGTAAAGSFLAGMLQESLGWQAMAWVVLGAAVVGAAALVATRVRPTPVEVPPIPQAP